MSKLRMTLACWDYDRTRALADGSVAAEGIELVYLPLPVEETFFRMLRGREFDCAEMSLSSYVLSLGREDRLRVKPESPTTWLSFRPHKPPSHLSAARVTILISVRTATPVGPFDL